jgi:hypothetical protein
MIEMYTKKRKRIHQKLKILAKKIHKDASNIFSFGALSDCKDTNLLMASKTNKFDNSNLKSFNTSGKMSTKRK